MSTIAQSDKPTAKMAIKVPKPDSLVEVRVSPPESNFEVKVTPGGDVIELLIRPGASFIEVRISPPGTENAMTWAGGNADSCGPVEAEPSAKELPNEATEEVVPGVSKAEFKAMVEEEEASEAKKLLATLENSESLALFPPAANAGEKLSAELTAPTKNDDNQKNLTNKIDADNVDSTAEENRPEDEFMATPNPAEPLEMEAEIAFPASADPNEAEAAASADAVDDATPAPAIANAPDNVTPSLSFSIASAPNEDSVMPFPSAASAPEDNEEDFVIDAALPTGESTDNDSNAVHSEESPNVEISVAEDSSSMLEPIDFEHDTPPVAMPEARKMPAYLSASIEDENMPSPQLLPTDSLIAGLEDLANNSPGVDASGTIMVEMFDDAADTMLHNLAAETATPLPDDEQMDLSYMEGNDDLDIEQIDINSMDFDLERSQLNQVASDRKAVRAKPLTTVFPNNTIVPTRN